MPLLAHVRVKTAGEGPGLLVVYLDWIGGPRRVSRVAADEQKTGLALEFRDQSGTGRNMPHRKGDAEEFPLLAQNAINNKRLCRPTSPGNLPQFRTASEIMEITQHSSDRGTFHDPPILRHQTQRRSDLLAPTCHRRIHPAVPPYHPKLTQTSSPAKVLPTQWP
jgi:hypothetical protein